MRRRLTLAIVGVTCASLVLLAVPLGLLIRREYRDREVARLERDALAATRVIDVAGAGRDPVELAPLRDPLAVYDASGRRIAGRGPARADSLTRAAITTGRSAAGQRGGQLVAAVPLVSQERVTGALRQQRSGAPLARHVRRAWLELAGLAAAILALAALAAVILSRRLSIPLERLAGSARRLGDGDFSARSPRSGVPELDAVSAALDATAERLDELLSRERAFTANASHQLRTPLAALRLELEALALREDAGGELAAALVQVERLQATIDTLLALARDTPRSAHDTDLTALVSAAARDWTGRLATDARPLRVRITTPGVRCGASEQVVTEVLDVLLANALEHGAGAVLVTVRKSGRYLAVDVADEGPGLADGEAAFRRRGPEARGLGIGLALARSLAQAEGGDLTASGGPGPVFTLTLPPADPEPSPPRAQPRRVAA